jgi:type IV pilus assembly protein PilX
MRTPQQGITLVTTLILTIIVMLLGASAAHVVLQSEKSARGDRDRQIAMQAAEAGLLDAESDIEGSLNAVRAKQFNGDADGFTVGCHVMNAAYLGLCIADDGAPPWLRLDASGNGGETGWVSYGMFTGQSMQTGDGSLPAHPPRYLIERLAYNHPGASAEHDAQLPVYRVTVLGFGMRESTQVMLQTVYRKAGHP